MSAPTIVQKRLLSGISGNIEISCSFDMKQTARRVGRSWREGRSTAKLVQERLGRAGISMPLNRYSHVMPRVQRDVADCLAALLQA